MKEQRSYAVELNYHGKVPVVVCPRQPLKFGVVSSYLIQFFSLLWKMVKKS